MEVKIGLSQESAGAVCHLLEKVLADEFVLYTKTRKAHWCVTGSDFLAKHKYFEELYLQIEEMIDEVAERIRILGHYPVASLKEFANIFPIPALSSLLTWYASLVSWILPNRTNRICVIGF